MRKNHAFKAHTERLLLRSKPYYQHGMMKLLSLYGVIIISSSAATATAAEDSRHDNGGGRRMTTMTTMELEQETKRFIQANNIGQRATPAVSRKKGDTHRTL